MSPNAIGLLHEDGTFIEVNPSFTLITGFSKEEAIGKTMKDLGIWVNIGDREKILRMLLENKKIQNMELLMYKKNGKIMQTQFIVRKGTLHEQTCYLTIIRDISKRIAAEVRQKKQDEALLISRNKLSTAATLAGIGPWEYDVEKEYFEFCDEFYAIYGTSVVREGQFMRFEDYIREFVYPEDICIFKGKEELLKTPKKENGAPSSDTIHRIIRRDGVIRTIIVRRRIIKDIYGNIIKIYGTNQDITERIRSEEKQRTQAETIEYMAYYDSLTGLPNKNNLQKWLDKQMNHNKDSHLQGTVLLVDLDQLKMVNDAYGHNFGDKIIITISKRLLKVVDEKSIYCKNCRRYVYYNFD